MKRGLIALKPADFEKMAAKEAVLVIDTRSAADFAAGHITGSIFIGLDGGFAPWVGALIESLETPILFIAEEGREEEVVTRLARVGYDSTVGYLQGGVAAWHASGRPLEQLAEIRPKDLADLPDKEVRLLDVRKQSEYESQHVIGARSFPLNGIYQNLNCLDPESTYYLHCQGGYRSMIACSILLANGFKNIVNVQRGFKGLKETSMVLSAYHEPVTML